MTRKKRYRGVFKRDASITVFMCVGLAEIGR